jgi:hypothetical protein
MPRKCKPDKMGVILILASLPPQFHCRLARRSGENHLIDVSACLLFIYEEKGASLTQLILRRYSCCCVKPRAFLMPIFDALITSP